MAAHPILSFVSVSALRARVDSHERRRGSRRAECSEGHSDDSEATGEDAAQRAREDREECR